MCVCVSECASQCVWRVRYERTINFLVLKGFPLVKTQRTRLSALVPINNKISPQPELLLSRDFVGLNPVLISCRLLIVFSVE